MRTFEVNRRLAGRHEVKVFTSVYKHSLRSVERAGVHYRRLGFRVPGVGSSPHLTFLVSQGLAISRTPHDLVVEEFTPPVGFCGLPWWTRAPVISIVQWNFFEQWEKRYRLPFSKWMTQLAKTGRYRHVIVQSESMAREFKSLLPNATICTIPPGIDDYAFIEPVVQGEYVLFLGRIDTQHKGLDLLIEAWSSHCRAAKVPLVIAGAGPAIEALRDEVRQRQLEGLIRFIGRVEGTAKMRVLQNSRIVVVPSRYETFGLAALEGMAAGKPVVCFNIDHLSEVAAAPWAVSIPAFDTQAFGRAVAQLWENPAKCSAIGTAARERARCYHWDQVAQKQEDFYLQVYHSSHAPA